MLEPNGVDLVPVGDEEGAMLKKLKEMDEANALENPSPEPYQHHLRFKKLRRDQIQVDPRVTTLETTRCENDILYCLFHRPETIAPLLFTKFHELVLKKNSPDLAQSRMFRDAMSFLQDQNKTNYNILIFQILLFVCREVEAQSIISEYNKQQRVGHLEKFVFEFNKYIDDVFKMPFGEGNVIWVVNHFVKVAEIMYMSK